MTCDVTAPVPIGTRGRRAAGVVLAAWLSVAALAARPAAAQTQYNMNTDATLTLTLFLLDANWNVLTNAQLNSVRTLSDGYSGGHEHPLGSPGGAQYRLGRTNISSCNTGWDGRQCVVTVTSGDAGGTVFIQGTIATGPQAGQSFTMQQPIYIGSNGGNYLDSKLEWMSGPFALIGQRPAHPDNHWCRSDFCVRIVNLANSYRNGSGLTIAYNDCSLSRGGLFDHQSTWRPPHSNHRGGFECDVRANGGDNSIPFDPGTRLWFENLVLIEVGPQPAWWHEDQNTGNEHYHIVG